MKYSDKETAGIGCYHEGETPSDKKGWAEAVREQEKNMQIDVPSGDMMPDKGMIRKYKGN